MVLQYQVTSELIHCSNLATNMINKMFEFNSQFMTSCSLQFMDTNNPLDTLCQTVVHGHHRPEGLLLMPDIRRYLTEVSFGNKNLNT